MKTRRCVVLAMVCGSGLASEMASEPAFALDLYKWKKRPLVVFAPGETTPDYVAQRAIVSNSRAGFAERDVVIVFVVGDRVRTELGDGRGLGAETLRKRFGVAPGAFRALLVGKDGGVKLSSGSPLAAATLFKEIDAMPMRRDEIALRKR